MLDGYQPAPFVTGHGTELPLRTQPTPEAMRMYPSGQMSTYQPADYGVQHPVPVPQQALQQGMQLQQSMHQHGFQQQGMQFQGMQAPGIQVQQQGSMLHGVPMSGMQPQGQGMLPQSMQQGVMLHSMQHPGMQQHGMQQQGMMPQGIQQQGIQSQGLVVHQGASHQGVSQQGMLAQGMPVANTNPNGNFANYGNYAGAPGAGDAAFMGAMGPGGMSQAQVGPGPQAIGFQGAVPPPQQQPLPQQQALMGGGVATRVAQGLEMGTGEQLQMGQVMPIMGALQPAAGLAPQQQGMQQQAIAQHGMEQQAPQFGGVFMQLPSEPKPGKTGQSGNMPLVQQPPPPPLRKQQPQQRQVAPQQQQPQRHVMPQPHQPTSSLLQKQIQQQQQKQQQKQMHPPPPQRQQQALQQPQKQATQLQPPKQMQSPPAAAAGGGNGVVAGRAQDSPEQPPANATSSLYIDNLPPDVTQRELTHIFRPYAGFTGLRLVVKEHPTRPNEKSAKAFVDFSDTATSTAAMQALNGYQLDLDGKTPYVMHPVYARPPKDPAAASRAHGSTTILDPPPQGAGGNSSGLRSDVSGASGVKRSATGPSTGRPAGPGSVGFAGPVPKRAKPAGAAASNTYIDGGFGDGPMPGPGAAGPGAKAGPRAAGPGVPQLTMNAKFPGAGHMHGARGALFETMGPGPANPMRLRGPGPMSELGMGPEFGLGPDFGPGPEFGPGPGFIPGPGFVPGPAFAGRGMGAMIGMGGMGLHGPLMPMPGRAMGGGGAMGGRGMGGRGRRGPGK